VILHIGSVADLVRQIQETVDRVGEEALRAPVVRLRATWAKPIFPPDHPFNRELAAVLLGDEPLQSLALVSAQLHLLAPEGEVPDDDKLNELQEQVSNLIDEVRHSDELPDDLRRAIASRLMQVREAVEHVHVGGPDAVRRAVEAVTGTVVAKADPHTSRTSTVQKVWVTLGVVWVAFSAGPKIQDSLEAWPKIVQELSSGQIVGQADNPDAPPEPTPAKDH